MKLNPLAEAVLWLPGFAPGEDPLAIRKEHPAPPALTVIDGGRKPTSISRTPRPALAPKQVWPKLDSGVFDGLGGDVAKFDANLAAIELLRELEESGRAPTDDERKTLNRFTGWGGLPQAFSEYHVDPSWKDRTARLKEVLSADEYEAARASTPNAHFTPLVAIEAMWAAVRQMGFTGGRVLEPSAGTGFFIGAMPTELAEKSAVTAIELEPVSARIAKQLYGSFGVRVKGQSFESTKIAEGFYDLVISNVPFGNYKVPELRQVPYKNFAIHDYFFARALEVAREGGLVAFITSAGTMDKVSTTTREYLASKAELVGAIRLPSGTFKAIAGTTVTSDILFFRKKGAGEVSDSGVWVQAPETVPTAHPRRRPEAAWHKLTLNPHYLEDSSWVIGDFGVKSNGYGMSFAAVFEGNLEEALAERVAKLPKGVFVPKESPEVEVAPRDWVVASAEWIKPGAYVIHEEMVAVSLGDELRIIEQDLQRSKATRIKSLIPVRDAARKLVAVQAATEDDRMVETYRTALAVAYDGFVKKHGFIHETMNQRAFREDPDFPLLLSLEIWDEESRQAERAPIFTRRTVGVVRRVERCETPEEALLVCLAERAKVAPARIAELTETDADDVMSHLHEAGLVYREPGTELWVERDRYLSGNVRIKLMEAEAAGEDYASNVAALTEVLPPDVPPADIGARLGSSWIPVADYDAFVAEVLEDKHGQVRYNALSGAWSVSSQKYGVQATQTWGTSRVPAGVLLEMTMNQQSPRVTDPDPNDPDGKKRVVNPKETVAAKEKQESQKAAFIEWLWADDERAERLARKYNDEFNSIVSRKYDGSHLQLPGFSLAYDLHQHQKDVIWRTLASEGNTLMAHAVGAGKTLSMICAGMEARRVGLASKPVYAVPNHMLEQFAGEFLRAYPAANVLIASKEDMAPDRRKLMLARMATGDWDAVVITHASFEKIPLPHEFVISHVKEIIAEQELAMRMEQAEHNTKAVKQIERAKKMWEARLAKLAEGKDKDDLVDFAEIGFDFAVIDEAHMFKNLYRFTRLRMAGLPTNDSFRAFDMYLKTRYVMESRGEEKGVVFATGTPIANSVAEMYTMQTFLQPRLLARAGCSMFDTWAANFGEPVTALELAPDGSSYRVHTRFARFVNVPELMAMFREVADIRTAEMMDLPIPEALREVVSAKGSPELKAYVAQLVDRAEKIRNGEIKDPRVDNMLKVTTDGRKAATDMRLVARGCEEYDGSKINLCVDNVFEIWAETAEKKGTQLVFLDMGTPGTESVDLYEDMRGKLCALGVPREEVAFIHEANTDKAKEALFAATRAGKVRVLIGSTAKMGVGTNVQRRLAALHHVDGPWRPADVEQRDGRAVRQGNLNATVRILRYVTEGSFDAYVWQTLETKARFIAQVMSGDTSVRTLEDAEMAALSYAEVKALASGNPLVIEKAGVDAEVMRLTMLRSSWQEQSWGNRREVAMLPDRIARGEAVLAKAEADQSRVPETRGDSFRVDLDGQVYTDRENAGKRILGAMATIRMNAHKVLGKIGGFSVEVDGPRSLLGSPTLYIAGELVYEVSNGAKSALGVIRSLEHTLGVEVGNEMDTAKARIARDKLRLEQLRAVLDQPFEHAERFAALVARKEEIDRALGIFEGDKSVEVDVAQAA